MAYAPATNLTTTGTLTHLAAVWYNRVGLDVLRAQRRFLMATESDAIPQRNGTLVQWYRFGTFAANTSPTTEGAVGTGLALNTETVQATVQEYSDFISISSLLKETSIDPIVENAARELSYRAALTVDTLVRFEFDTGDVTPLIGSTLAANDVRQSVAILAGQNVLPKMGESFCGIIHPFIAYDLMSEDEVGGFIDVLKYTNPQQLLDGEIGKLAGVRFFQTTNVNITAGTPDLYRTYIVGAGAVGSVDLSGVGPSRDTQEGDASGREKREPTFKIQTIKGGPSASDPEGKIGAYVSYRFVFAAKILDETVQRFILLDAPSSVTLA